MNEPSYFHNLFHLLGIVEPAFHSWVEIPDHVEAFGFVDVGVAWLPKKITKVIELIFYFWSSKCELTWCTDTNPLESRDLYHLDQAFGMPRRAQSFVLCTIWSEQIQFVARFHRCTLGVLQASSVLMTFYLIYFYLILEYQNKIKMKVIATTFILF